jgi:hypothetical protein
MCSSTSGELDMRLSMALLTISGGLLYVTIDAEHFIDAMKWFPFTYESFIKLKEQNETTFRRRG